MILVTGATGNLGSATIAHLLKNTAAKNIVAFVRDAEKAKDLEAQGIEIRIGNFDDKASLEKAMQGIEKVLLISTVDHNRFEQHKNAIDAAQKAGVKQILYTGISMKDLKTSALFDLMESHFQTEDYLKESGIAYTFLRNSQYLEVIPMFTGEQVFETGIYLPAGNGTSTFALRREMGEAAAQVLLQTGHENKTYDLTGSQSYSYAEVAQTLSELSGKAVHYTDANPDEFAAALKQFGVPEFAIYLTAGFAADHKNKQFEFVSKDLENLLGRKPASLKEGLKEIYKL